MYVFFIDLLHLFCEHPLVLCLYINGLTLILWVLQNKTCVQTLEGHAQNVSCVSFHPELPIIITGSEDGEEEYNLSSPLHTNIPTMLNNHNDVLASLILVSSIATSSLCRYGAHLALKHLPPGEHSELWHGESLVCVRPQGLQQCGVGLRRRQHHY